ncbi:MAG: YceI family protein [Terrabacter sp.]
MTSEAAPTVATTDLTAGTWRVVPLASTATFTVRDKTFLTVRGGLPVRAGTATLHQGASLWEAHVELDARAIDTGNARRDRDLARPGLLDYTTHPTIVVTAGPTALRGHGWDLAATLSAGGADCPLDLRAVAVESSADGVRVHVTGRLDRNGLRLRAPRFIIGRYIDIDVSLLFTAES